MCDARADFLQFVCNNKELFQKDRLFSINNDPQCHGADINLEQEERKSLPQIISDQYKKPTFIIKMPIGIK